MNADFQLASYDYHLPSDRIAQTPMVPRDHSRLLVVGKNPQFDHCIFRELDQWLQPGDLLVLNNTQVIPARLQGRKVTGTAIEVLLLEERSPNLWLALVKPGKRLPLGTEITFVARSATPSKAVLTAQVIERDEATGGRILQFASTTGANLWDLLADYGEIPFPPYVSERTATPDQYQTIYGDRPGAVAAPTAGLHFTEDLFQRLAQRGITRTQVTLHVGVGTFRPVEAENILEHQMHQEWIEVPAVTVEAINRTKANGGRIIAVGTTAVRSLEGVAKVTGGHLQPFRGKTDLFIYPGYQWQVIDGLITNFHLPKSSLLMMISAFVGRERLLSLYQTAIAEGYRFYSFGDAMLLLPEAQLLTLK